MNLTPQINQYEVILQKVYDLKQYTEAQMSTLISARKVLCDLDTDEKWTYEHNWYNSEGNYVKYFTKHSDFIFKEMED